MFNHYRAVPAIWFIRLGSTKRTTSRCFHRVRGGGSVTRRKPPSSPVTTPGSAAVPAATPLPAADLENAAIEQVAPRFANPEKLGEIRDWPAGGNYVQVAATGLLPSVRAALRKYIRFLF